MHKYIMLKALNDFSRCKLNILSEFELQSESAAYVCLHAYGKIIKFNLASFLLVERITADYSCPTLKPYRDY